MWIIYTKKEIIRKIQTVIHLEIRCNIKELYKTTKIIFCFKQLIMLINLLILRRSQEVILRITLCITLIIKEV